MLCPQCGREIERQVECPKCHENVSGRMRGGVFLPFDFGYGNGVQVNQQKMHPDMHIEEKPVWDDAVLTNIMCWSKVTILVDILLLIIFCVVTFN